MEPGVRHELPHELFSESVVLLHRRGQRPTGMPSIHQPVVGKGSSQHTVLLPNSPLNPLLISPTAELCCEGRPGKCSTDGG